ncbi:hypothetical protein ACFYXS_00025 [Streptomyces sp. NPDC002574]|uniref:hypothetical protein n=1 Tax=Streptomyces sp. NPDC002574 TaxID=3364652 RepID=UPI0036A2A45E
MTHRTSTGSIWRLRHRDREIARLTVTGTDFPWVRGDIETLPGYEDYRAVFAAHQRALDDEDYERADLLYDRIRADLTMTFPDEEPVAEFLLNVHGDGTAGWRWHDEPFDEEHG